MLYKQCRFLLKLIKHMHKVRDTSNINIRSQVINHNSHLFLNPLHIQKGLLFNLTPSNKTDAEEETPLKATYLDLFKDRQNMYLEDKIQFCCRKHS